VEPVKGKMLRTMGYTVWCGPLLRVPEGKIITVEVFNDTDAPELVHWHGLHIASEVDGSMEEARRWWRRTLRAAIVFRLRRAERAGITPTQRPGGI